MMNYLAITLFRHQKVEKDYSKYRTLNENKDSAAPELNDCHIEHKKMAENGQFGVIIKIPHTNKLLARIFLNERLIYSLSEISGEFPLVLKHLCNIWIVASFPLRFPQETNNIHLGDDLGVDILKMIDICTIFRYILNVAFHIMDSSRSILEILGDWAQIEHRVLGSRLMFF